MNVSQQLLSILAAEEVKHIFGLAGDALNPLITAIDQQDEIKWIKMNHEGNASFAAYAQGELNGNLGVCASTVGPGALHLVNGLYNAKKARTPVLAITGQVPIEHLGTNYHQEVDLKKIFDDICDYQAIIRSPEEAPRVIIRALRIAINEKTVCRIELPADIAQMEAANQDFVHKAFRSKSKLWAPSDQLAEAVGLIDKAEKVAILAGVGCRDVREEVLELAKKLQAPITSTIKAIDIFDRKAPNVVGLTGLIGNGSGYDAVKDCDLLLMLGTDFPYVDFLPENTKIIQFDARVESIGNRIAIDLGLHAHLETVIPALLNQCKSKDDNTFLERLRSDYFSWIETTNSEADPGKDTQTMQPQSVSKIVSDVAADDAIFILETGTSVIWSSNHMSFHADRRILGSFNHGSMGAGLPAAIGAQLQYPDREVWALVGDGAFNMTLHEFATAAAYNLPIKVIIFNNAQLGFVKIEMEEAGLAPNLNALAVNNMSFSQYAELCEGQGMRVEHPSEAKKAIESAKKSESPFIVDAIVSSGALSLPPKITAHQVKNFGVSKVKELIMAINGDKKHWENVKKEVEAFLN